MKERDDYFKERITGRLSTKNLRKNYERKGTLERELSEIVNFKYYHEEWFK